jgi:hypothetical protein
MYIKMTLVWSSAIKYRSRSASSMSLLLPTETTADRPMFSVLVLPMMAMPSAPLWVMIATPPAATSRGPKEAFIRAPALYTPKIFGPITRMPWFRAIATSRFSFRDCRSRRNGGNHRQVRRAGPAAFLDHPRDSLAGTLMQTRSRPPWMSARLPTIGTPQHTPPSD